MATKKTERDLVGYVSYEDVKVVLARLPEEAKGRLRDMFLTYRSRGVRRLGFVRTRGRRDINLCAALPPRVSLGRFLRRGVRAAEFGAPARGQWPPWAVRRYLLYNTLLHELGHLQLVRPKSRTWRRRFAGETLASQFATSWRKKLWSSSFDHPDLVHNPPGSDELSLVPLWQSLNKKKRYALVELALQAPHEELPDLGQFGEMTRTQRAFLSLALCHRP